MSRPRPAASPAGTRTGALDSTLESTLTGTSSGTPTGTLAGTALLTRLALRRSRGFWPAWVLLLAVLMPATVTKYEQLMPAGEATGTAAALSTNVTLRAMLGPPYDLLHAGSFVMWRVGIFVAAAAAMMAALGVIRATRAEEEEGRTELLRAGAVGRHAPLAAALIVGVAMSLLLGGLITAGMTVAVPSEPAATTGAIPSAGSGSPNWAGALAAGAGIALTGCVWAGLGALAAQIQETSRGARSLALGALGVAYLVRALADGAPEGSALQGLRWASPVEWAALVRPYAGERWWVLALPALLTVVSSAAAVRAGDRRDLGAGLRAARLGPVHAPPGPRGAAGLTWRLNRGSVIGWAIGMLVAGVALGTMALGIEDMLATNPQLADMFRRMGRGESDLTDAFYVAILAILATVLAVPAVAVIGRLRGEEEQGRAEYLLSTPISRGRLAGAHVLLALVVPAALLVLTGALLGVPQALHLGSIDPVRAAAGGAAVLVPGLWVVSGLALLVLGWAPRWGWLTWLVLGWSVLVVWLGAVLAMPDMLLRATPWAALPSLPGGELTWPPILGTTAVAALLIALGFVGYTRRDLPR